MRCGTASKTAPFIDDELVRLPEGWRIAWRTCRVIYWTGNPRVQTPSEDIAFELGLARLHEEDRPCGSVC